MFFLSLMLYTQPSPPNPRLRRPTKAPTQTRAFQARLSFNLNEHRVAVRREAHPDNNKMDRSQPASSNLMETHNRLVAAILTHYRTLMMLATVQAEASSSSPSSSDHPGAPNTTPEAIAVAGIAMKMEFDGLYSSVKELLTLSRRIKELWVFGALGQQDPKRAERGARVEADVKAVAAALAGMEERRMGEMAARHGGKWEPLRREDVLALQALAGKQQQ